MGLYDLVTLKTSLLNALNVEPSIGTLTELRQNLAKIKTYDLKLNNEQEEYINSLINHYDNVIESVRKPSNEFKNYLGQINSQIEETTHRLFANNYELEKKPDSVDYVRTHRKLSMPGQQDKNNIIREKLFQRTSWLYPSLEIGCRDGEWTQYLTSSDPLYIVDQFREFLEFTNNKFNEAYQKRLRKYQLVNHDLSMLPAGQFAFVFSWGYFNYVSMDTMKIYLRQIFDLLRPGGSFLFTYNDGDTPQGAGLAEGMGQTYMPRSFLIPLAESFGFEVLEQSGFSSHINWLELKRPGELKTIKAHQVLGKIRHKPSSISTPVVEHPLLGQVPDQALKVNVEALSLDELRDMAIELGIGTPDTVRYGMQPDQLKQAVKERLK